MAKGKKGAQAAIYRVYLPIFLNFLQTHAKYDIDGDGNLWCSKEDWYTYLCPIISEDHGNAIGYHYCKTGARTAAQMLKLIQCGKEYICHRLYNMRFVKNLERRREGRNVTYFRLLGKNEVPTRPIPDTIYLLKKIFVEEGVKEEKGFKLTPDQACNRLCEKLNERKFPDDDAKIKEWRRAIGSLAKKRCVKLKNGYYVFTEK